MALLLCRAHVNQCTAVRQTHCQMRLTALASNALAHHQSVRPAKCRQQLPLYLSLRCILSCVVGWQREGVIVSSCARLHLRLLGGTCHQAPALAQLQPASYGSICACDCVTVAGDRVGEPCSGFIWIEGSIQVRICVAECRHTAADATLLFPDNMQLDPARLVGGETGHCVSVRRVGTLLLWAWRAAHSNHQQFQHCFSRSSGLMLRPGLVMQRVWW